MDPDVENRHLLAMNDHPGQREPMIHRARDVAVGFADVGLTHAEELLRRMSPEGREQARREREAKARRQQRLLVRTLMAAIASLLAWALLSAAVPAGAALALASALMLLLTILVFARADPRAPGREALGGVAISGLAEEAGIWLAAQRRGLPPAAIEFADAMSSRLDDLTPWLSRLDPRSPAAASLRKLVSVELPALIEGWRMVPISARRVPLADGRTPDVHLINGLQLLDAQLGRARDQLGQSSLDEIAVQGRYLELKYSDDDRSV